MLKFPTSVLELRQIDSEMREQALEGSPAGGPAVRGRWSVSIRADQEGRKSECNSLPRHNGFSFSNMSGRHLQALLAVC
ncbi:unnamed protein product [Gongylonema pulchrum]|uniref:Uncharacterized protein n=1 Tax=Gongylonema pulchrum TaxID=637853 RepID=A0A183E0F3_9BILA|nr:unnamed protein product [Gongylonema pulchrum]